MANYVFNAAKELLMKGHINLTTADFDGSTITAGSDDTHNNLVSAGAEFRVVLIKSGSTLTAAGETHGSIDAIDCATMDNITTPGYVKFYIGMRVGGIVSDDTAIKAIKCAV